MEQFKTIKSFGNSIFRGKITIGEAYKTQSNLLENILELNNRVTPRVKTNKKNKVILLEMYMFYILS